METRPKLKLQLSITDNIVTILSLLVLVSMWFFVVYTYQSLPEIIPTHFNAAGKADSFGNKTNYFFLPVLATILYFGLSFLNRYPHIFNYLNKITEQNARHQYTVATRMLRYLNLTILIVFSTIMLFTYQSATGQKNGPGPFFLIFICCILFIPLTVGIIFLSKKSS